MSVTKEIPVSKIMDAIREKDNFAKAFVAMYDSVLEEFGVTLKEVHMTDFPKIHPDDDDEILKLFLEKFPEDETSIWGLFLNKGFSITKGVRKGFVLCKDSYFENDKKEEV